MSDRKKKTLIYLGFSFILAYFLSIMSINYFIQNDTLWHLKAGQYMVEHKTILTKDVFSWVVEGKKWYSHEWLWEIMAYLIYKPFGFAGLFVVNLITLVLILFIGQLIFDKLISNTIFILGIFLWSKYGYTCSRPHVLALLMLLLVIYIIKIKPKYSYLYISMIFLIWTNIHSSVVFGVILVSFIEFLDFLEDKKIKNHIKTPIVTFISSLINPHFINVYLFFIKLTTAKELVDIINEWLSPNFHDKLTIIITIVIIALIIISARKMKYKDIIIVLLGLTMYLTSIRNIAIFAILSAYAVKDIDILPRSIKNIENQAMILIQVTIIMFIINNTHLFIPNNQYFTKSDAMKPFRAIEYMIKNNIKDKILNDYHLGGYLIFKDIKCSVDSRGDLYYFANRNYWNEYVNCTLLQKDPEEFIKKYKIKYIYYPTASSFYKYLLAKGYKVLYKDDISAVLEVKQ